MDSPVFSKKYPIRLRRYSIVYTLSIAIHLIIFLLLFFFPLRVGTDGLFGKGSAIRAGLVMENNEMNEGKDPDRLIENCIDTPHGDTLLRRFAEIIKDRFANIS